MKAEHKRLVLMLPVLAVAGYLALFGDKTPTGGAAMPTERHAGPLAAGVRSDVTAPAATGQSAQAVAASGAELPLRARIRQSLDAGAGGNLFAPPVNVAAQQQAAAAAAAAAADEGPPVPAPGFTYIGRMFRGGNWWVFLDKNGQTYVAFPGTEIDGFRVDSIKSDMIQLYHVPSKSTHIIPIEGDK